MLLKVSLAGGGQLDGNKLVATKRRVRQRLLRVNYLHREGSENFKICMSSYNSPSVLEAGDDGTNEATLSIELETGISRGTFLL